MIIIVLYALLFTLYVLRIQYLWKGIKMLFIILLVSILIYMCLDIRATVAEIPGRFTERARTVINYANEEAIRLKHGQIDTEHLLLGLVYEGQGIGVRALEELGVSLEELEMEVKGMIEKPPVDSISRPLVFTHAANQVLQYAMEEAQKLEYDHVGTEHILLGLVREKDGIAAKALDNFGVTERKIRRVLRPVVTSTQARKKAPRPHEFRDGSKDATKSIQYALDEAGKAGDEVFLPAGRYRLEGHLAVPAGVTLRGTWTAPHHAKLRTGTVLLAYGGRGKADAPPLISLSPGSTVRGLTIFYPEQTIEDVQPYPWTIQGRGMHNSVIDVTLVNPYKGIDVGSFHNELHYLRNIFGCPLKVGVYVNNCTDIGRIENVHFNPHYWGRDEGDGEPRPSMNSVIEYLLTESEAFVFGRTDWEYVLNTFCYGNKIGYHFIATEQGVCNGNFLGIGADGTKNAIVVDQASPIGLLITNGEFVSMRADDPVEIIVGPENSGTVQFSNCAFWGPANQIARIEGSGLVSFMQCNFVRWDHAEKKLPAIEANGGSLSVQNCYFRHSGKQIRLGPDLQSAIIRGNQMTGEIDVDNQSKGSVQMGFNVTN